MYVVNETKQCERFLIFLKLFFQHDIGKTFDLKCTFCIIFHSLKFQYNIENKYYYFRNKTQGEARYSIIIKYFGFYEAKKNQPTKYLYITTTTLGNNEKYVKKVFQAWQNSHTS